MQWCVSRVPQQPLASPSLSDIPEIKVTPAEKLRTQINGNSSGISRVDGNEYEISL
jgi:hypothetical protein